MPSFFFNKIQPGFLSSKGLTLLIEKNDGYISDEGVFPRQRGGLNGSGGAEKIIAMI